MRFTPTKIRRRLVKSVAQKGVLKTAVGCAVWPASYVGWKIIDGSPFERQRRAEGRAFDRDHDVDTERDRASEWSADVPSEHWAQGTGYHPTPPGTVRRAIESLGVALESYTFIDVGSGKCRVPMVAAEYPFTQCLGVEYDPGLHQTAEANIRAYRNDRQRCPDVRSLCVDATKLTLPDTPLVLFFHDPFSEEVLGKFLANLRRGLEQHPRDVRIIEYDPVYRALLKSHGFVEYAAADLDSSSFYPAAVYKLRWFDTNTFRNRLGQEFVIYRAGEVQGPN
jgi:hypothetical protein